ncbi:hypothetical protein BT69DRAFT_1277620 [Atractiella rhizophila]|nr:hypothetical protein BT69DRAFT_1277620 [Atractiella rhizophila]
MANASVASDPAATWATSLLSPTPALALLRIVYYFPRLTQFYKYIKFVERLLSRKSEIQRILEGVEGGPTAESSWKIDFAIQNSFVLPKANAYFSTSASEEPVDELDECSSNEIETTKLSACQHLPRLRETLYAHLSNLDDNYRLIRKLIARSQRSFDWKSSEDEKNLRAIWRYLMPEDALDVVLDKRWQDVGFQGSDPSTDFRATGMLGLDSLLFFAREHSSSSQIATELNGTPNWYPFALASIAVCDFVLSLLKHRDLQYLLFSKEKDKREQFVFEFHSRLLVMFHLEWKSKQENVMQFERLFSEFKSRIRYLVRAGIMPEG